MNMFNFPESSISQAVKAQLNAQFSFFTQYSDKVLDGVQKINELNAQVAKTMLDESLSTAQRILATKDQQQNLSVVAGQAQPAAEKIRAYQQHVQNILMETQAGIAKIVETHMPETARAAEAVVREVAQKATDDTARATQRQKEALEKVSMPITSPSERSAQGSAPKPPTH
jgi:phasin family protein